MVKQTICLSITGVWLKAAIHSSNLNVYVLVERQVSCGNYSLVVSQSSPLAEKDGRRNLFSCAESCGAMNDDDLS